MSKPFPSATPASGSAAYQLAILSPLQIDSPNGRIFAVAQVNGEPKIAVLAAEDGHLIAAWDEPGQLALDAARGRLVVDRGGTGVALINTATGETQAVIDLPRQDAPPAPQINTATGLVYAFRESTVYVIDPAIRGIVRTTPLEVPRTVCDNPSGDAPIHQTAYDAGADRLYLSFVTQSCPPWTTATLIAYDTVSRAEIGRTDFDINTYFLPYGNNVYGVSVSRLGPTMYWAWDGVTVWHDESGDFVGNPAGMVADSGRGLIYEAVGETIRVIDPEERSLTRQVNSDLLATSQLAGHDPGSDNLYFVSTTGRLYTWAATNLFDTTSPPSVAPSPLPPAVVRVIALAPNWSVNQTMVAILDDQDCAGGGQLFILINPDTGWIPSTTAADASCQTVTAVAFSPAFKQDSLLFAATSQPPTILRSFDTGRSWTAAETVFPDGTSFSQLIPSAAYAGDQTLFTLTTTGLVYRSRDGGRNWQLLDQRLDHLTGAGGAGPAIRLFGVFGERVLHSTDGGQSWQDTGTTPNDEPLVLMAVALTTDELPILYAFTAGGRFARSLDAGATWNSIMETSSGPAQLAIVADSPEEERPIFLLHDGTISASYDGMASIWAAASTEEASRFRPTAIAVSPQFADAPYLFIGTLDGQIIRIRADAQP